MTGGTETGRYDFAPNLLTDTASHECSISTRTGPATFTWCSSRTGF